MRLILNRDTNNDRTKQIQKRLQEVGLFSREGVCALRFYRKHPSKFRNEMKVEQRSLRSLLANSRWKFEWLEIRRLLVLNADTCVLFLCTMRARRCTRGVNNVHAVIRVAVVTGWRVVAIDEVGEGERWRTGVHADVENMSRIIVPRDTDRWILQSHGRNPGESRLCPACTVSAGWPQLSNTKGKNGLFSVELMRSCI